MEEWRLNEHATAMEHHQDEENGVEVMCEPEGLVDVTTGVLDSERVHDEG